MSLALVSPLMILCAVCHQPLAREDALSSPQRPDGPRIDVYVCGQGCGGKLAVIFELDGAHVAPEPSVVEREVARRGSFFPSDYTGGGRRPW